MTSSRELVAILLIGLVADACATATPTVNSSKATPAPPAATTPDTLGEATAVSRAEEFVKRNGYVRREDADPTRLVRESCCADGDSIDEILAHRAGTLLPSACAVVPRDANGAAPHWTVVFCYDPRYEPYRRLVPGFIAEIKERGRAVVMGLDGTKARMIHQDFLLSSRAAKRLPAMEVLEHLLED